MKVNVTYKKIKNLHLRVKNGEIYVSAPYFTSDSRIQRFINNNMDFINKQLENQENIINNQIKLNDDIIILNNKYTILKTEGYSKVTEHFIFLNERYDYRIQIKLLFKMKLYKYMVDLTKKYFSLMNFDCDFPRIIIKDVKSKWGSYNRVKHEIIYASELLFKDSNIINYIVVHELSHIIEFNHSSRFYNIVSKYCPNYKELRKKLKG